MDILYEPANLKGTRGDWCFDWVCPNQDCSEGNVEKNRYSNFVDGGGVFPGSLVKVECQECKTVQFLFAGYEGDVFTVSPPMTPDLKVLEKLKLLSQGHENRMKKRLDFISKSKAAFELYSELYDNIYGKNGPSISSYCRGENKAKNCGCWVHQLLAMLNTDKS